MQLGYFLIVGNELALLSAVSRISTQCVAERFCFAKKSGLGDLVCDGEILVCTYFGVALLPA